MAHDNDPARRFLSGKSDAPQSSWNRFVNWTTQPAPQHKRWSAPWFGEQALLCTVFAITGSSSMYLVRPFLPKIGLEGSWREGPWSYRIGSFILVSPIYTALLLLTGSLAGRHNYFAAIARRMWGRFLPRPLAERVGCTPAKIKASKITTSTSTAAPATSTAATEATAKAPSASAAAAAAAAGQTGRGAAKAAQRGGA
ncbi:hypothetical protein JKP88DRAFT_308035 [Tribonema minus]|uniref:DUF6787 domain-containing protein n=1 Tax=Tribonema minus TaxID=303371 RepID=A0A835Z520_9STRA|nr:hypothetical protein JKP88DRAFT_308007 [Tribonema minus]KAG5187140.1 hypothetical protein JKP88DRAFT_308035 [Tribonema minus]